MEQRTTTALGPGGPATFTLARRIPAGSAVAVAPGQEVAPDTVIATGYLDRRVLRLPAGDNFELLKKPGDPVKKGETVAVMEEVFGLGLRELVSPCDGVVESVNSRRTALVVTGADSQIRALARGTVASVGPGEIRLTVTGYRFEGYFGLGKPVSGKLWAAGELLTASDCKRLSGSEVPGRVVLADSYVLPEVLPILARRGAVGLICGGLDFGPLWDLISPDGPHPAGQGLPSLVVLGGFGVRRIDTGAAGVLAGAQGRPVYLSGPVAGKLVFAGPPYAEVVVQ